MRVRTRPQQSFARRHLAVGHKVAVGAGFQFLGIGFRTAVTLLSTAALARLLSPTEFGLVAMATVVTEFAALLGAFGFGNVLVQQPVINRLKLDTTFWASLAAGAALAVVVGLVSLIAGRFFADADVGRLLRLMSFNFVLNSLSAVPAAVLARLMLYRLDFLIQISVVLVRAGVAVTAAWGGLGMWSLVIAALVGSGLQASLSLRAARYWPRLRFHSQALTRHWRTNGGYLGNGLLHYVNTNLDLLLIGRALGATSLGFYQNARSLTDEIRGRIAMPLQQVLFPAFSALQADRVAFQALVMRAGRLLVAVVIPVGFGVSANAELLVRALYGTRWLPMVDVMSLFGLAAAVRAAAALSIPLFNATDRVGLALRYNVVGTALLIGAVLVGMPWGVEAVAAGVALASLYPLVSLRAALAQIGLGTRDFMRLLVPPLLAASGMWLAGLALNDMDPPQRVSSSVQALASLAAHVGVCAAIYLLLLALLAPALRSELLVLWRKLGIRLAR
ncbi:lipopolysaccharide biosynthesis protein [Ideonella sp. DXS22W]|uniref:Lipopolysaccharide biosynthesis protein n=1 Tax=Pseudaquabacterium inlustre TaxID=2984192 RepID=A0ABU9CNH7_9BURK